MLVFSADMLSAATLAYINISIAILAFLLLQSVGITYIIYKPQGFTIIYKLHYPS